MTQDTTDYLISKIIEEPDRLTDAEIAEIISNEYLRDLYHTASLLKTATAHPHSYDLDCEWQAMHARLNCHKPILSVPHKRKRLYVAAIFICILLCGATGILFFRLSDIHAANDQVTQLPGDSFAKENQAVNMTNNIDSIATSDIPKNLVSESKEKPLIEIKSPQQKALGLTRSEDTPASDMVSNEKIDVSQDYELPSINQALYLTDDDIMMAQMFLASCYDSQYCEEPSFLTTVNFGDSRTDSISQPTWLSEVIKYATGLTVDNLMIQRGSANMLYRLTCTCVDVSISDRKTAFSIISSLVDDGLCINDPLTMVLVLGSQENLK